jgi:xylan 1,4-beta-xylosidase
MFPPPALQPTCASNFLRHVLRDVWQ